MPTYGYLLGVGWWSGVGEELFSFRTLKSQNLKQSDILRHRTPLYPSLIMHCLWLPLSMDWWIYIQMLCVTIKWARLGWVNVQLSMIKYNDEIGGNVKTPTYVIFVMILNLEMIHFVQQLLSMMSLYFIFVKYGMLWSMLSDESHTGITLWPKLVTCYLNIVLCMLNYMTLYEFYSTVCFVTSH